MQEFLAHCNQQVMDRTPWGADSRKGTPTILCFHEPSPGQPYCGARKGFGVWLCGCSSQVSNSRDVCWYLLPVSRGTRCRVQTAVTQGLGFSLRFRPFLKVLRVDRVCEQHRRNLWKSYGLSAADIRLVR